VDQDAVGDGGWVRLCIGVLDFGGDHRKDKDSFGVSLGRCMVANGKFDGWLCGSGCGIVAKRLSGSRCRWDDGWVGSGIGVLNFGGDRRMEVAVLGGGMFVTFHCNQWECLCEGRRRGSSQIALGLFLFDMYHNYLGFREFAKYGE